MSFFVDNATSDVTTTHSSSSSSSTPSTSNTNSSSSSNENKKEYQKNDKKMGKSYEGKDVIVKDGKILPDAVIYLIFHFVEDTRMFTVAALRTCKRWSALLSTEESFKERMKNERRKSMLQSYDGEDRAITMISKFCPTWKERFVCHWRNCRSRCVLCGEFVYSSRYGGEYMMAIEVCSTCQDNEMLPFDRVKTVYHLTAKEFLSNEIQDMRVRISRSHYYCDSVAKKSITRWFEKHFENGMDELRERKERDEAKCLEFVQGFAQKEKRFRQILKQELTAANDALDRPLLTENLIINIVNTQPIAGNWLMGKEGDDSTKTKTVNCLMKFLEKRQQMHERVLGLLKLKDPKDMDQSLKNELEKLFQTSYYSHGMHGKNVNKKKSEEFDKIFDNKTIYHCRVIRMKSQLEKELKTQSQEKYTSIDSLPRITMNAAVHFLNKKHQQLYGLNSTQHRTQPDQAQRSAEKKIEDDQETLEKSTYCKDVTKHVKKALEMAKTETRLSDEFRSYGYNYEHCHIPTEVERYVKQQSDLTFYQALRELCKVEILDSSHPGNVISTLNPQQRRDALKKLIEELYGSVEYVFSDKFLEKDTSPQDSYAAAIAAAATATANAEEKEKEEDHKMEVDKEEEEEEDTKNMSEKKKGKQPLKEATNEAERYQKLQEGKKKAMTELFEAMVIKHMMGTIGFEFNRTLYRKMIHQQSEEEWRQWEEGLELPSELTSSSTDNTTVKTTSTSKTTTDTKAKAKTRDSKASTKLKITEKTDTVDNRAADSKVKPRRGRDRPRKKAKLNDGEAVETAAAEMEDPSAEEENPPTGKQPHKRRSTRLKRRSYKFRNSGDDEEE